MRPGDKSFSQKIVVPTRESDAFSKIRPIATPVVNEFEYLMRVGFGYIAGGAVARPYFNGNGNPVTFPFKRAILKRLRSSFVLSSIAGGGYIPCYHTVILNTGSQGQYIQATTYGAPTPAGVTDLVPATLVTFDYLEGSSEGTVETAPFVFENSAQWAWGVQVAQYVFAAGDSATYQLELTFKVLEV
jgi:hypothetical protein